MWEESAYGPLYVTTQFSKINRVKTLIDFKWSTKRYFFTVKNHEKVKKLSKNSKRHLLQ